MKLFISFVFCALLLACGGGSSSTSPTADGSASEGVNPSKKVLASNVIFSTASAVGSLAAVAGADEAVDTTTKVLAQNVMLDTAALGLVAENVQGAFEEVEPDWSKAIVGRWTITELRTDDSSSPEYKLDGGAITFSADGTSVPEINDWDKTSFSVYDNRLRETSKQANACPVPGGGGWGAFGEFRGHHT